MNEQPESVPVKKLKKLW